MHSWQSPADRRSGNVAEKTSPDQFSLSVLWLPHSVTLPLCCCPLPTSLAPPDATTPHHHSARTTSHLYFPVIAMSRDLRSDPLHRGANDQGGSKRQRTSATAQSSTVSLSSLSRLLQLPAAVLSLVYLYVPWYERLLHVSHLHRQLPSAWLLWAENDHVRLTEALVASLERGLPSAVQCCLHVQSLHVEEKTERLLGIDALRDKHEPAPPHRFQLCLRLVAQVPAAIAPFSNLHFLVSTDAFLQCLLDHSTLPHLHSLSVSCPVDNMYLDRHLASLPALRRLRPNWRVSYRLLFALPCIEHVDIRIVAPALQIEPAIAFSSPHLRHLLLEIHEHTLYEPGVPPADLLAVLVQSSLQTLSIKVSLTTHIFQSLATLRSLTALELMECRLEDDTALARLVGDNGAPLLPNLERFVHRDEYDDRRKDDRMMRSCVPFVSAYRRQLRYLNVNVNVGLSESVVALLSIVMSSMPQLESLKLSIEVCSANVVHKIVLPSEADMQPSQQPALPNLRLLSLCHLSMSNFAVAQLLASSPNLLYLSLDRVSSITTALWPSLLHCRQLLGFYFAAGSVMAPTYANRILPWPPSPSSTSSTAAFPACTYFSFSSHHAERMDVHSFTQLLHTFTGSPINTVSLCIPHVGIDHAAYLRQLASLPHLSSLRVELSLDSSLWQSQRHSKVQELLDRYTDAGRETSEQHHVNMQYFWQQGLLGEDEDELRTMHAAEVRVPAGKSNYHYPSWYRVFKRAQSEGEEDGRTAYFQALAETESKVDH